MAVQEGDEVYILARELLERVGHKLSWKNPQILTGLEPRVLEGKKARHPLYDRESLLILAPYVTLEEGTGIVHTAPGHGQEDYESGLRYHLDIYSPLDDGGRFLPEVGFFAGQFVFEANDTVKEKLREVGSLKGEETITHSYPHCWRCKKPVIFRATEQWFLSMETNDLRKKALAEIDRVTWMPAWGRNRIYSMMENRPDWCLSRQRSWGVPIPVFYCQELQQLDHHRRDPQPPGGPGLETWNRYLVFCFGRTTPAPRDHLSPLSGDPISKRNRYPGCLVRFRCEFRRGPGGPFLPGCPGRSVSGRQRSTPGLVSQFPAGRGRDPRRGPL